MTFLAKVSFLDNSFESTAFWVWPRHSTFRGADWLFFLTEI